jgi:hypothetical protein
MKHPVRLWFPLAIVITLLSGLIYVAIQQDMRQSFNEPQLQIAGDAAHDLTEGPTQGKLDLVMAANGFSTASDNGTDFYVLQPVDIAKSLGIYLMFFDEAGNPALSAATLHGVTPVPPAGVFEAARAHGENRITWQPEAGVRQAIVVIHYNGGFVLAGANMRELERREMHLEAVLGMGWVVTLIASLAAALIF